MSEDYQCVRVNKSILIDNNFNHFDDLYKKHNITRSDLVGKIGVLVSISIHLPLVQIYIEKEEEKLTSEPILIPRICLDDIRLWRILCPYNETNEIIEWKRLVYTICFSIFSKKGKCWISF